MWKLIAFVINSHPFQTCTLETSSEVQEEMSGFVKSDNQKHIRRTTKRTQQQAIIDKTGTKTDIVRHIQETVTILCCTSNFPIYSTWWNSYFPLPLLHSDKIRDLFSSFCTDFYEVHATPKKLENCVFRLVCSENWSNLFLPHYAERNLKTQQSMFTLDIRSRN